MYLTRALARLLAPRIRVNAIAPGTVLLPENFDPKFAAHLTATTPLGRDGTPDDVVQAMLYLLHADYVTGETIIVDGGRACPALDKRTSDIGHARAHVPTNTATLDA